MVHLRIGHAQMHVSKGHPGRVVRCELRVGGMRTQQRNGNQ